MSSSYFFNRDFLSSRTIHNDRANLHTYHYARPFQTTFRKKCSSKQLTRQWVVCHSPWKAGLTYCPLSVAIRWAPERKEELIRPKTTWRRTVTVKGRKRAAEFMGDRDKWRTSSVKQVLCMPRGTRKIGNG